MFNHNVINSFKCETYFKALVLDNTQQFKGTLIYFLAFSLKGYGARNFNTLNYIKENF